MQDIEGFLAVLKQGKIWMDSMLEMVNREPGMAGTKKVAIETCKKKEFEHMANLYLKDVPIISELIKPGRNDTKLKLKSKLSDIVLLGNDIIHNHKIYFDNSVSTFREQVNDIINETEKLKEEITSLKALESEMKLIRNNLSIMEADCPAVDNNQETLSNEQNVSSMKQSESVETVLERPNYCSVSEFLEEESPKNDFWNTSESSVKLIQNLSKVLQEDSLNNLLVLSTSNVERLVVEELFEALTKKKWPNSVVRGLHLREEGKNAIKICKHDDSEEAIGCLDYLDAEGTKTKEVNLQTMIETNSLLKIETEEKNSKIAVDSKSESHHCVNVYTKSDFSSATNYKFFNKSVEDNGLSNTELVVDSKNGFVKCNTSNKFTYEMNDNRVNPSGEINGPNNIYKTISISETIIDSLTGSANCGAKNDFRSNIGSLSDEVTETSTRKLNGLEHTVTANTSNKVSTPASSDSLCVCDDDCSKDSLYSPTTLTVQQVTEMLFTLSSALNKVPDDLKHARMVDLNPPQSMKEAISMLAHISKSIDIVQISKSCNDGEVQEERISRSVERKPGYCSLIGSYKASRESKK